MFTMEFQLSIVIPTCNRHDTLVRAINSVINQGIDDIEVIVVNDGVDNIPSALTDIYCDKPYVIFLDNGVCQGAAGARNFGVRNANGYYVSFLDDDDMYLPGRLLNMLNIFNKGNYIFASSGRFYEIGDFTKIQNVPYQLTGEVRLEDIKFANDIDIGFMVSRSDFLRVGGFDPSFTNLEDWDFVIRMLKEGKGYKLGRLDYAVNVDPNRERVSTNDSIGYRELAEKYKHEFGVEWYSVMLSMADRLEKKLTLRKTINYTFNSGAKLPFIIYLKYKFQFLKKYFI